MVVEYFVGRFATAAGKTIRHIGKPALEQLKRYPWPGNIRELQNVVERAVTLVKPTPSSVMRAGSAASRQSRRDTKAFWHGARTGDEATVFMTARKRERRSIMDAKYNWLIDNLAIRIALNTAALALWVAVSVGLLEFATKA